MLGECRSFLYEKLAKLQTPAFMLGAIIKDEILGFSPNCNEKQRQENKL